LLLLRILVGLVALAAPIALYVAIFSRRALRPSSLRSVVATFVLGAIAFVPAELLERTLTNLLGLRKVDAGTMDLAAIVYAYLVAAPLEEGLKVASAAPAWRLRLGQNRPIDAMGYATAGALGFATAQSALFLSEQPLTWIDPARASLHAVTATFLATAWGYALGRDRTGRIGGGWFNSAWVAAMFGGGVAHHVSFVRGPTALLSTLPIIAAAAVGAFFAARDLLDRGLPKAKVSARKPRPASTPAPKQGLRALRAAIRGSERPLSFFWIALGALVTTGVITSMLIGAVLLGRRLGVEFSAVDRDASQATAIPPLLLLAGATLFAFLIAGWVVSRASAARSVVEPAISALVAIGGTIVLLGLAAPVAVVIALACAPLALGLACLGAWLGLSDAES